MCSSMRASSICLYIDEINIGVKLLFEEDVAEYLSADQ